MCATRSAALVRGTPFSWAFQMIWLAHFLTLPLVVTVYTLSLVVIPVWDTDRAAKVTPPSPPTPLFPKAAGQSYFPPTPPPPTLFS